MADPIILVELTGYTDVSVSQVYRYSTGDYTTGAADTPAHTWYDPIVIDPGTITRTLVAGGGESARANPRAEVGYGLIRLANISGALDSVFGGGAVSFRERQVRVLSVLPGAAYSTAKVLLVATISQMQLSIDEVTVGLKDRLYELDSPHLTATYGGTNVLPAGVDGVDDIKGKVIPALYGTQFAIPAIAVNTSKRIYQVSSRALQSLSVAEGGAPLTAGTAYTSQADMEANAPASGQYRAWLAGGMFRIGTSPTKPITADASADTAGNSTAAQLLKALAIERGISSGDIDAADVTALDAANDAVLGVWVNDGRSTLEIMDDLARSVGAVYRFDRFGKLRMARFDAPSGTATASLAPWNIGSVEQLQSGEDVPTYTVAVRYARYWQALDLTDVDISVSEADRADLQQEWRIATYAVTPSPNPHKRPQKLERDTCLTTKADADDEALRLHGLVSVPRRSHQLTDVQLDLGAETLDVGAVVGLRWGRYGFSQETETLRTVTSITNYLRERRADMIVWGA